MFWSRKPKSAAGFTLIELVVVITIAGIIAVVGSDLISQPVRGYLDLARRTRLVDQAEMALRRMQRDIRHALPNSVRISGGGKYLELLHTSAGGRYRRFMDGASGDILDFSTADSSFDVLGDLTTVPTSGTRLVVYNVTSSGPTANAYSTTPAADNMAVVGSGSSTNKINLNPAFQFTHKSDYQRFFVVDRPVTYACEGALLNRYAGYGIAETQPTPPGGTPALVTRAVDNCEFRYDPGASQRAGLVTLELSLTEAGETITLLHQVHVVNAP